MSYAAMLDRNEFDIKVIEDLLSETHPQAKFCWPRIGEDYQMDAIAPDDNIHVINRYGILEPSNGEIVDPLAIDIVMIPLLAFDQLGYRVGYGKGYYDRFLCKCRRDVIKIGFSFFEAEPVIKDIDNYDVPLNYCITPLRVYEF
jgi:5-formyltetrahydrofolate cyclo-ligase